MCCVDGAAPRARWLAPLIAAGVLAGHALTYAIVRPDAHERAAALAASGHGYLDRIALPLAVIAIVALAAAGVRGLAAPSRVPTLLARCVGAQVGLFGAMEVVERWLAGAPLADLLHGDVLLVGLVVQIVLGAGLAWLLRRLFALGAELAGARPVTPPQPAIIALGEALAPARRTAAALAWPGPRAPPRRPVA